MKIVLLLVGLLMAGCITDNSGNLPENKNAYAVIAGLNRVDPAYYKGWAGHALGCDKDAKGMAALCKRQGIRYTLLLNEQATKEVYMAEIVNAFNRVSVGGLVVVFFAGHGGQVADRKKDETDHRDETICLYNGHIVDDTLYTLWGKSKPGTRIFFVTESCNAGTNFQMVQPQLSGISWRMVHFGASGDGASSYGRFSPAMEETWKRGITYVDWFNAARSKTKGQVPVYVEVGASFGTTRSLE